jgi:hypothetical protein
VSVVPVSPGLSPPLVYLVVGSNLISRRVGGAAPGGLRPRSSYLYAIEDAEDYAPTRRQSQSKTENAAQRGRGKSGAPIDHPAGWR